MVLITTEGLHQILMLSMMLCNHLTKPQVEQDCICNLQIPACNGVHRIANVPNAAQLSIMLWRKFTWFETFETANHRFAAR